jgi:hypothetical protein
MFSMKRITRAGLIAATCGLMATAASAQTQSAGSDAGGQPATSSQASGQPSGDQAAARQHLAAAQQALADLTKLPAAAQLQGDQRATIAKFIGDFNAFATASADWRTKYQVVDESLNKILEDAANAPAAPAAPATPPAAGAPPAEPGPLDPTIVEKLKTMRTELDQFETSSGDPVFMVKAISKILDSASSGGGANLSASQLSEVKSYLEKIRSAAMH